MFTSISKTLFPSDIIDPKQKSKTKTSLTPIQNNQLRKVILLQRALRKFFKTNKNQKFKKYRQELNVKYTITLY